MIEIQAKSKEGLTLRVRPRDQKTFDEDGRRRDHQPIGHQIHLTKEEICPKNRNHRCRPLNDSMYAF